MAKSKKSKPKRTRVSLSPLREQLQVLVNIANQKVDNLLTLGSSSRALIEAQRTLKKQSSRNKDDVLFRSDLKTRKQINREFARVHAFLGDYTSSVEGSESFETDLTTLKGAFGGEWQSKTGENFDTSRVDKEIAGKTFEIYRKTVEAAGGWERAVGMFQGKESLIGYGSENLITNIYDMLLHPENFDEEAIMVRAREMVQEGITAYEEMSKRQVSDYDYGIVFDDETTQSRRAFYTWKHKFKNAQKG